MTPEQAEQIKYLKEGQETRSRGLDNHSGSIDCR